MRTTSGRIGLPIVTIHLLIAAFGSWLAPYSPTQFNLNENGNLQQLLSPSFQFLFGTDQFGRDVLSRVMTGSTSLVLVAGAGTLIGITGGAIIGMGGAYRGGWTDEFLMRIMDGLMSFPSLLMALLVISTLGPNVIFIVLTIGIVTIPGVARVMRSTTLSLKEQEFVQSAVLRGESAPYIIFREILPNTLPIIGVELSVRLSYSILIVASLGFLGLGVQPPSPDWGLMISQGRQFLASDPWVAIAPSAAVASLVVGINLLTDGVRQARNLPKES
jgi:peptide/nickel transport system permease protein